MTAGYDLFLRFMIGRFFFLTGMSYCRGVILLVEERSPGDYFAVHALITEGKAATW
jgi:hypothetical protein